MINNYTWVAAVPATGLVKRPEMRTKEKLSEEYRSSIIGCGLIAGGYDDNRLEGAVRTHALAYQLNSKTQLVSVVDVDTEKARIFAERWNAESWYENVTDMLRDERPDLVSICTPDNYHVDLLEHCLDAESVRGVWCEKPLATNTKDAGRLVSEFQKSGKTLLVNYPRGYASIMQSYKERLLSGEFGTVQKIIVYYTKGVIHNGSHALDLLMGWFGAPDSNQVIRGHIDYSTDDPTVDALIMFNDIPVYLMGLDEACYSQFEIDVFCSDARLSLVQNGTKAVLRKLRSDSGPGGNNYLSEKFIEEDTGADYAMSNVLDELLKSIEGDCVLSNGSHVLDVLYVCEMLARKGCALLEVNAGG